MFFLNKILKAAVVASLSFCAAMQVAVISADPAFANSGGNGNASGIGALALELDGLTAVHAMPAAMANAAADSMPGKLFTYQQARRELVQRVTEQNAAFDAFVRLETMSDAEAAAAYPLGGHTRALNDAARAYNAFQRQAEAAQAISEASLMSLSGGRTLSSDAMSDLHRLLGL